MPNMVSDDAFSSVPRLPGWSFLRPPTRHFRKGIITGGGKKAEASLLSLYNSQNVSQQILLPILPVLHGAGFGKGLSSHPNLHFNPI